MTDGRREVLCLQLYSALIFSADSLALFSIFPPVRPPSPFIARAVVLARASLFLFFTPSSVSLFHFFYAFRKESIVESNRCYEPFNTLFHWSADGESRNDRFFLKERSMRTVRFYLIARRFIERNISTSMRKFKVNSPLHLIVSEIVITVSKNSLIIIINVSKALMETSNKSHTFLIKNHNWVITNCISVFIR